MWTSDGPTGTIYNRSSSGWFDGPIFVDWFKKVIIPHWKNTDGVKCLIGDNLVSHLSMEVIELCEKHSIRFCFLPPSSTHLLQPLDVSVFASLKKSWRKALLEWKLRSQNAYRSLPKTMFPAQLSLALDGISDISANVLSGFRKCGIIPLNRDEALSQLPRTANASTPRRSLDAEISESFIEFFKEHRFPYQAEPITKRKRRLQVCLTFPKQGLLDS